LPISSYFKSLKPKAIQKLEEKEGDLEFVLTKVCAKILAKLSSQNTILVKKNSIFFTMWIFFHD
jgi:hypothetical protein